MGKKIRDWLSSGSFEEQYEFGIKTIRKFNGFNYLH
jgi:hypothetical protein